MKIWRLYAGEYTPELEQVGENQIDFLMFDGKKIENWKSACFKAYKKGKYRDFAYYVGGVPVFSLKTLKAIEELIADNVQLLDIVITNLDIEYKLVNITTVIDAVDYSRSIPIRTFKGRVREFEKLKFLEDMIKDKPIFRLPEFLSTRVYVSDAFREKILAAKLKGFDFEEVWDSEWTDELELEQQERYQAFLANLEMNKGKEFDWSEAIEKLKIGKEVASNVWRMKYNQEGELCIARLGLDCEYVWSNSDIIPPILLGLKWYVIKE